MTHCPADYKARAFFLGNAARIYRHNNDRNTHERGSDTHSKLTVCSGYVRVIPVVKRG